MLSSETETLSETNHFPFPDNEKKNQPQNIAIASLKKRRKTFHANIQTKSSEYAFYIYLSGS